MPAPMCVLSVRVPRPTLAKIDQLATLTARSRGAVIRQLLDLAQLSGHRDLALSASTDDAQTGGAE